MNRKGNMVYGLISLMVVLLFFGMFSLFAGQAWNKVNAEFQALDSSVAPDYVKEDIDDLTKYMTYMDTAFVVLFGVMVIVYLLTAGLSNPQKPIWIIIFIGSLILVTLLAMIFSNMWKYTLTAASWDVLDDYTFTDWVLSFMPVITFFVGITGGIIFFARKRDIGSGGTGGGGFNQFG